MKSFTDKIENFQKKISTYDRANWEIIVENYKHKSNLYEFQKKDPKNHRRLLIDLDLFRGKPFQKAKPLYHWSWVTMKALFRMLLYPFYLKWWIEYMDIFSAIIFLVIYIMEVTIGLLYSFNTQVNKTFSLVEIYSIHIITIVVGEIYIHVISNNLTRPKIPTKDRKRLTSCENSPPIKHRSLSVEDITDRKENSENFTLSPNIRRRKKKSKLEVPDIKGFDSDTEIGLNCGISVYDANMDTFKASDDMLQSFNDNMVTNSSVHITHSSSSLSETEEKESEFSVNDIDHIEAVEKTLDKNKGHIQEEVMVTVFEEGRTKKIKISIWDIVQIIEDRANSVKFEFKHLCVSAVCSVFFAFLPCLFKVYIFMMDIKKVDDSNLFINIYRVSFNLCRNSPFIVGFEMFLIVFVRFLIIGSYMFLLFVAENTYRMRFLYAKYFGALTSYRRAKRNRLPHFRLHKVRNIKAWLSLRSYLRRCGPLRSIDLVVSFTFYLSLVFITLVCGVVLLDINVSSNGSSFYSEYFNWEIPAWAILLSSFLLRFLSLGAEVNRKYNNFSELLTEQINLYLHMEMCPQKKDEYMISNNVLKLAAKVIKEIESPQKVTGFIMNPLLRNITRVVILSLISGVISECFGITFKFWKINA